MSAMEIKASWRILNPGMGHDTTRFYMRNAIISMPKEHSANGQSFTVQAKVGLVGMHINNKDTISTDMSFIFGDAK